MLAALLKELRRDPRLAVALELAAALAVLLAVWWPFLAADRVDNRFHDWSARGDYSAYQQKAIFTDYEFPFWVTSPRFEQFRIKGVHDFFANPETDVLSVTTPLTAVLGFLNAVKLSLVLYLALGVLGCWRLLRALGGNGAPLPLLVLSLLGLANGAFLIHLVIGHFQFASLALFPLALALTLEAAAPAMSMLARTARTGLAGGLLAVAYDAGNTHLLLHFLGLVALYSVLCAISRPREAPMILGVAALLASWFVVLAAFKLWPGWSDFHGYFSDYSIRFESVKQLVDSVLTPADPHVWSGHEFNSYLGNAGVALLGLGLLGTHRRTWPLLIVAAVFGWLIFAERTDWVMSLPLLRTQGAVTRMRLTVLMTLAVVAASGLERLLALARLLSQKWIGYLATGVVAVLVLGLAYDLSRVDLAPYVRAYCISRVVEAPGPFELPVHLNPDDPSRVALRVEQVTANRTRFGFEVPPGVEAPLLVGPELPLDPRPPHLRLEGDAELTQEGGHLAVRLHGSKGEFTLAFSDPHVVQGFVVSSLAWIALAYLTTLAWKNRAKTKVNSPA